MCNSFHLYHYMSLLPSVKVLTSAALQHSYFTSELFVSAARADIESLLSTFEHLAEDESEPYTVFKRIWIKEGWNHAHLFVWDDGAREQYMQTMFRLFLERVTEEEDELLQAGVVFAVYTLFKLQAASTTLHQVTHIPIAIDTLQHLTILAKSSSQPHQPHLVHILQYLVTHSHFHVVPSSELKPYNPTILPHSYIDRSQEGLPTKQTGKSGKTRTELDRIGRRKWQMLNTWVDERTGGEYGWSSRPRDNYSVDKAAVVDLIPEDLEASAEKNALGRLKALSKDSDTPSSSEGIERFEKMLEKNAGILRNRWKSAEN